MIKSQSPYLRKKVMLLYNLIQHLVSFNSRSNITLQYLKFSNKIDTNLPHIQIIFEVRDTHTAHQFLHLQQIHTINITLFHSKTLIIHKKFLSTSLSSGRLPA